MEDTVFRQMTCPGSLTSIRGNLAARWNKASAEIVTPEVITPPT